MFGIREIRGQVAQVIVFAAIGDGFEVFCISPVGDADIGDLPLFGHIHSLLFFYKGIIRKLIPGDPTACFHKTDDPLCVRTGLGDLIQGVFDGIVVFHFHRSFVIVFFKGPQIIRSKNEAHKHVPQVLTFISFRSNHELW